MRFIISLTLLVLLATPIFADNKKSKWTDKISGMTWGSISFPKSLSIEDEDNIGFDMTYQFELDTNWQVFKKDLVPYLTLFTQTDSERYSYNSKQKMTFGLALKTKIGKHANGALRLGYAWDYRPLTLTQYSGVVLSASFNSYKRWDKEQGRRNVLSTWAVLKFPGSLVPSDKGNLIGQGQVTLAHERPIGKTKFDVAGFTRAGLFLDKENYSFNNKFQLDAGIKLKRKIFRSDMTLSGFYRVDKRFKSGDTLTGPIVSLSWFRRF